MVTVIIIIIIIKNFRLRSKKLYAVTRSDFYLILFNIPNYLITFTMNKYVLMRF